MKKKIAILGSTGSIGKTLINILIEDKENFEIKFLSAEKNYKKLFDQAKILNVKNIDDKIEISLDFNKGVLLLKMNEDQSNIYNLHFSSYQLNDLRSDIILSNKKKMELINFEGQLKFYSKTSKKNNKAEAYKAYELMPNADMKISYEILNLDQFNQKFHGDCEKVLPQFTTKKNKKWEMQYGCITQNGRLVCGNRYK